MIRLLFNLIGTLAVVLGVIGIVLPLLPTTPFLLLALACYMRGSRRMARWMITNRLFGRYLLDIQAGHGIPLKTKIWALTVMWVSLAISAYVIPLPWVRPLLLVPGIGVTIYLWRYKTKPVTPLQTSDLPDDNSDTEPLRLGGNKGNPIPPQDPHRKRGGHQ